MRQTVRTMCPMNCHPTLCGMLVEVEDGRLRSVRGDPVHRAALNSSTNRDVFCAEITNRQPRFSYASTASLQ